MKARMMAIAALLLGMQAAGQQADWSEIVTKYEGEGFSGVVVQLDSSGVVANYTAGYADFKAQTPITTDTRFRIGYLSELFTAVPVFQLIDEGNFDLDTPIQLLMPQLAYPALKGVTVNHLLTHTSGLPAGTLAFDERTPPMVTIRKLLKQEEGRGKLGKYQHSTANYLILGQLVQKYLMKNWEYVVEDNVIRDLGLTNTDEHERGQLIDNMAIGSVCDPQGDCSAEAAYCVGNLHSAGCLFASAEDMATFFTAFSSGHWFDAELLKTSDTMARNKELGYPGILERSSQVFGFTCHVEIGLLVLANTNAPAVQRLVEALSKDN